MNLSEFVASPVRFDAIRDTVLEVQREIAPEELEVTDDYTEPWIELAAREGLSAVDGSGAGGFGGGDWMLAPVIVTVMGALETRLVAGSTREITEGEVRGLVSRSGFLPSRKLISNLTRSVQTAFSRHLEGFLASTGETGEQRYTDISCPQKVWKGTSRFHVVVRLTLGPVPDSAANESLPVVPGQAVQVHLNAPAFHILSAAHQEITVPAGEDSLPVVFDLRPRETGHHEVSLDFLQETQPLASVNISIEVGEESVTEAPAQPPPAVLSLETEIPPPERLLLITWQPAQKSLSMSLIEKGHRVRTFPPLGMADPAAWTATCFQSLDTLDKGLEPTAKAVGYVNHKLSEHEIDRRLQKLGQNLWRDLFPEEFRNLYAQERKQWRDTTLLIFSDEPYLPWELVWPHGEGWEDEDPWCVRLRLSRWLRKNEQGSGNSGAPTRLSMGALACISTTDLPAAEQERRFLQELLKQQRVRDVSPSDLSWAKVMDLLESNEYDWLHVAAHGNFHADAPDQHSAIWLEKGRVSLTPRDFVGPEIEDHLRRAHPAFFFNACHAGRLGRSLTGIGGWAQRLISGGAGMFLGPLWTVEDKSALRMAQTLYELLLKGTPVAEAVQKARQSTRKSGNVTWMAYSLYAHPNATLRLSQAAEE